MSRMVIYLGCLLPGTSSNLPKADGPPYALFRSCFGWGLHRLSRHRESGSLLHCLSALTTINVAVSFLLHYPWSHLHRTLSGILPYEARTFLPKRGDHSSHSILFYLQSYTLKQLPPINSLIILFLLILSLGMGTK